ncbi:hypothetical protein [Citrobacter sp. U14242]|uniref:hypothetical protein n=1 Tax=Citrobacter sp. U14242 TaxID=3390192 RepID=UPI00397B4B90
MEKQGTHREKAVAELVGMLFELHRLLKAGQTEEAIKLIEYGTEGVKRLNH